MKLEQTYIYRKGDPAYFVSTINRRPSTIPVMDYAETIAWEIDGEYNRGKIVEQDESFGTSLAGHQRVVEKLRVEVTK